MKEFKISKPADRVLYYTDVVTSKDLNEINKKIIEINTRDLELKEDYADVGLSFYPPPIQLYLETPGGHCYPTLGTISIMEQSKTPIHTISLGLAASAGFLLFISGHKRFVSNRTTLMYHELSSVSWGLLESMKEQVEQSEKLQEILDKIVTSKSKITDKKLKQVRSMKKDWFITPEEAIQLKVADGYWEIG